MCQFEYSLCFILAVCDGLQEISHVNLEHLKIWCSVNVCLGRIGKYGPVGKDVSLWVGLRFQRSPSVPRIHSLPPACGSKM